MKFLEKVAVFLKLKEHDADFKPEHLKFGEVTLESGDIITYDGEELTVGMVAAIVTPDGALPAPDGKHMTVDGVTIVIEGGEGVVTEIIPAVEEGADAPAVENDAEQKQSKEPEMVAKKDIERIISERVREFEAKYNEDKEKEIAELNFANEKKVNELTELINKQNEVIEKFNAQPAAEPVQEKFGIKKKGVPSWFIEGIKNK